MLLAHFSWLMFSVYGHNTQCKIAFFTLKKKDPQAQKQMLTICAYLWL